MNLRANFSWTDPSSSFLFGISLMEGIAEEEESKETAPVVIFSLGLVFFRLDFFYI